MGELTFQVNLLQSASDGKITPVLWRDDGKAGGFSSFGKKVKSVGVEYVNDQITSSEWEDFFESEVDDSQVVYLGRITIDDTKTVVDEAFFTTPSEGVEVRDHPLGF